MIFHLMEPDMVDLDAHNLQLGSQNLSQLLNVKLDSVQVLVACATLWQWIASKCDLCSMRPPDFHASGKPVSI